MEILNIYHCMNKYNKKKNQINMKKEQALQIIKAALDKALAKGTFETMQDIAAILQAFQSLQQNEQ